MKMVVYISLSHRSKFKSDDGCQSIGIIFLENVTQKTFYMEAILLQLLYGGVDKRLGCRSRNLAVHRSESQLEPISTCHSASLVVSSSEDG